MSQLEEIVETYSFRPDDLAPDRRLPGISAFMRIRNGADFLELAIRSHIDHFDEIVAVYNQCTDATPDILRRLAQQYGPKLRVYHYVPRVFPPGSEGHRKEPPDSPHSLVNYYNFALTRTRFTVATKLDDDHLAMETGLATLVQRTRRQARLNEMICLSGLNLARTADGTIGILATQPFSGSGDIGFFPVSRETYFTHDARFERFRRGSLRRHFGGIVYWHLKYLKREKGFANYELEANPDSRYARQLAALPANPRLVDLSGLDELVTFGDRMTLTAHRAGLALPERLQLRAERWNAAMKMDGRDSIRTVSAVLAQV
jgi:hypothetical protein